METFEGSRFERFQNFLYSRRMIYERLEVIGTKKASPSAKDGTEVCTREHYCRKGHKVKDCPAKELLRGTGDQDRLCFKCDQPGHQARACPESGGGAGGGRGGGEGSQSRGTRQNEVDTGTLNALYSNNANADGSRISVNSNTVRAADCHGCKYIGNQHSSCSGCIMTTSLNHCLYHCEGYAAEAVDKRAAMAKAGENCPVCLYPGHLAEACKNATNPKYVCCMKGCKKHHHPSLHGAKDKYVTSVEV